MFTKSDALTAVAFTYALAALVYYPPISGALVLLFVFAFTLALQWLGSRPKTEAPEIRGLRSELGQLRAESESMKGQVERLILGGRRGN